MAKAGRRSKYFTNVQPKLDLIESWCRDGDIETTIIKKLSVGVSTFSEYKKKYKELREVLKKGKEEVDYAVENALLKRALGYTTKEIHETTDSMGGVTVKEVTKEVPPDTTAQIYWLKNRKKHKWKDKWEVTVASKEEKIDKYFSKLEEALKNE